jgi:hypothetical protein
LPNRIIKESVCSSETIDQMSWFEECFYHRLWVNCDDYGRMDARPAILKAKLFPLKERMTLKDIESALQRLADIGCVRLYVSDNKPYLYLPSWEVHQNIRAKKSKYPEPDSACMQMHTDASKCARNPIQSNPNPIRDPNTNRAQAPAFKPPDLEDVETYCQERGRGVDPQKWYDFYSAKGWMIGKNKMKDWKAAVRTWEHDEKQTNNPFL